MKIRGLLAIGVAVFGAALAATGIYFLSRKAAAVPPVPPSPPEPPTGYTIEEIEQWVYEQYPQARRLSDGEAGVLGIDAGWVQLTYAGSKPSHASVASLEDGALGYHIFLTEPDVGDLGRDIASLVGFGMVGLPEGALYYTPAITPPKMWLKWTAEDKLLFIALVEAIAQVIEPPPDPWETEIRRAEYYNLVGNTKAPAILFLHDDREGVWLPVWGDLPELPDELDEEVSSVMVVLGYRVKLYDGKFHTGASISLYDTYPTLRTFNFNDKARSVEILGGFA